jgi:sensor domain CHASE-containing protein
MGLYTKVIILLGALFALYGAVNYAVQREVMLPSFESLEEDLARTDMERVARALEDEAQQLLLFCADWGNWLETYRFMAGEQPEFIEDNMTPATLEAARLDFVAYLDAQGASSGGRVSIPTAARRSPTRCWGPTRWPRITRSAAPSPRVGRSTAWS